MEHKTYTMIVNGRAQTLTMQDSFNSLRRDFLELSTAFNPDLVQIKRCNPPVGSCALIQITVNLSKYRSDGLYYLDTPGFSTPKTTCRMSFFIDVPYGFPATKPKVYFPAKYRNVHVNGFAPSLDDPEKAYHCYGDWSENSSLFSIARKVILAIIHDETVAGYGSPACFIPKQIQWQKNMARKGKFPAIDPALLYKNTRGGSRMPPPLPSR